MKLGDGGWTRAGADSVARRPMCGKPVSFTESVPPPTYIMSPFALALARARPLVSFYSVPYPDNVVGPSASVNVNPAPLWYGSMFHLGVHCVHGML